MLHGSKPALFPTIIRTVHWRRVVRFRLLEIGWWLLNYGGSLAASETTSFWWAIMKVGIEDFSSISSDDVVRNFRR
ncbi:hypothetical protein WAI453_010166 [Rhynchosporium graminicola]